MMRALVGIIGLLAMAIGLLFVGQGLGYIRWPSSSFMIDQTNWVYYGGAIAVSGLLLAILARR